MKRIGQKQLSLLLCLVLLFTMAIPAGARASDYFNNTYVSATAVGGGTLRIKVDVAASGIMQELGANARKEVLIPTQIRSQNIKNKVLYEKEGQHL